MTNLYAELGFRQPEYLENSYGIKIYIGTKGKEDWCVEIPKEIVKEKYKDYKYNHNYTVYLVDEAHALAVAKKYTELAKQLKSGF